MRELVFASNNRHKLEEIQAVFPEGWRLLSSSDAGFSSPIEETGETLEENALLKARTVHQATGRDCFADDTGLEVEALDGAPGV
jgi:XTP/dITP diphosphohydrolase